MDDFSQDDNNLSGEVIASAIHIHSILGPGLFEKVYQECLFYHLSKKGFKVEREKILPVTFEDVFLDAGYRLDLLIEDRLIVELKAVEKIMPVHEAQLYTYLKLSKKPFGLILNFNCPRLKDGIKRMAMTQ